MGIRLFYMAAKQAKKAVWSISRYVQKHDELLLRAAFFMVLLAEKREHNWHSQKKLVVHCGICFVPSKKAK